MKIIRNADLPLAFNKFTTHAPNGGRVWVATDSFGVRIVRSTEEPVVVRSDDEVFETRDFSDFKGYRPETITLIEFESAMSKSILRYVRIDAETGKLDYLAGRPGYRRQYYDAYSACGSVTPAMIGE